MTHVSPQSSSDTPIDQPQSASSEIIAEVSETDEFQGVYKDTLSKVKKTETYNASPGFPIIAKEDASKLSMIEEDPSALPLTDADVISVNLEDMWIQSDLTKSLLLFQLLTSTGNEIHHSPSFETFKREKDYAAILDQTPVAFAILSEESEIRKTGQTLDLFIYH